MDIATVVGVILGLALITMAILLGGTFGAYVDAPSMLIVLGGATCATMTAYPMARFLKLPQVTLKAVFSTRSNLVELVKQLVELAEVARRDGILALENAVDNIDDEFLVHGIQMAVDGSDPEAIEQVMETELENLMDRHERGKGLLDCYGRYAPAFGMIGTLIGLVAMLSNMDDPSKIGAGMAAALITTLYGAMLANIVFLPMADKLAVRSDDEVLAKTIVIHGVMAIQAGVNPRNVQSKLMTFVPPNQGIEEEDSRAAA